MTWMVLQSFLFGLCAAGALGTALLRWRQSPQPQRIAGIVISIGLFAWFVASLTRSEGLLRDAMEIGGFVLVFAGVVLDVTTRPDAVPHTPEMPSDPA